MNDFSVSPGSLLYMQFVAGSNCFRGSVRLIDTIPEQFILVTSPKADDFAKGEMNKNIASDPSEILVWCADKDFLYSFKTTVIKGAQKNGACLQLKYPETIKKVALSRLDSMLNNEVTEQLPLDRRMISEILDSDVTAMAPH